MSLLFRHMVTALSLALLLVSIAAACMWVRSLSTADSVPRLVEANQFQVHSAAGRLVFLSTRDDYPRPGRLIEVRWMRVGDERVPLPGIDRTLRERLISERGSIKSQQYTVRTVPAAFRNGFGFDVEVRTSTGGWWVIVPYWAVVMLTLVIPLGALGSRARRRLRQRRAAASTGAVTAPITVAAAHTFPEGVGGRLDRPSSDT